LRTNEFIEVILFSSFFLFLVLLSFLINTLYKFVLFFLYSTSLTTK
jgi:hypothetical protein